jgi:hypothetical protein
LDLKFPDGRIMQFLLLLFKFVQNKNNKQALHPSTESPEANLTMSFKIKNHKVARRMKTA